MGTGCSKPGESRTPTRNVSKHHYTRLTHPDEVGKRHATATTKISTKESNRSEQTVSRSPKRTARLPEGLSAILRQRIASHPASNKTGPQSTSSITGGRENSDGHLLEASPSLSSLKGNTACTSTTCCYVGTASVLNPLMGSVIQQQHGQHSSLLVDDNSDDGESNDVDPAPVVPRRRTRQDTSAIA